ncbi:hypothetical protein DAETH_27590 [Deinococcus aetherius]|uniref:Uncharacterized protein n=1 Tax=Deinococcus aetherius TaxID=200252 RepID=A0ABM8AG83_9DEIO|nr:hypothetical protein DAETH_27590 [Deinococcus aetherius]
MALAFMRRARSAIRAVKSGTGRVEVVMGSSYRPGRPGTVPVRDSRPAPHLTPRPLEWNPPKEAPPCS